MEPLITIKIRGINITEILDTIFCKIMAFMFNNLFEAYFYFKKPKFKLGQLVPYYNDKIAPIKSIKKVYRGTMSCYSYTLDTVEGWSFSEGLIAFYINNPEKLK